MELSKHYKTGLQGVFFEAKSGIVLFVNCQNIDTIFNPVILIINEQLIKINRETWALITANFALQTDKIIDLDAKL